MNVPVSGAGIAGPSLALRQRGLASVVVERTPRLCDGGRMLGLADPGLDAAERMGVAAALRASPPRCARRASAAAGLHPLRQPGAEGGGPVPQFLVG